MASHQLGCASLTGGQAEGHIEIDRLSDRAQPPVRQAHTVASVRNGQDRQRSGSSAPLDIYCRAFDHPNLFVVDASFLPTSAAVNPALTVASQALRVADHIASKDLKA
jgi:choline dehydrogenase-like flavoprotein